MFDSISPERWVEAMSHFKNNNVEFYLWGGEPFLLNGTYELINGFLSYDFVYWVRVDTNMTFTNKILKQCVDSRIKLNCSWHTHRFDFEQIWDSVMRLKKHEMVGMVNFVASGENMQYLKENNLDLDDLVKRFHDQDVFLNVAADFAKGNSPEYREIVGRYTCEQDWDFIHGLNPCHGKACDAADTFFNVDISNGDLTSCGYEGKRSFFKRSKIMGNFLDGRIKRKGVCQCPQDNCLSIISYCHQLDNSLSAIRHLDFYTERNIEHRRTTGVLT